MTPNLYSVEYKVEFAGIVAFKTILGFADVNAKPLFAVVPKKDVVIETEVAGGVEAEATGILAHDIDNIIATKMIEVNFCLIKSP